MFPKEVIEAFENGGDVEKAVEEATAPMRQFIEQLLAQRPFVPFRIQLTSKYTHEVWFPERMSVGKTTLTTTVPDPREPNGMRWTTTMCMLHVVSVETIPVDQPAVVVLEDKNER